MSDLALYQVPEKKRGHLKPYSGNWVRLMCVGEDSFYRFYLVWGAADLPDSFEIDTLIRR